MKLAYPYILIILTLGLLSCGRENNPIPYSTDDVIDPDMEIIDSVVISRIDTLGLQYRISSPKMIRTFFNRQVHEEFPFGFEVVFYNKKEVTQSSISSGYASIDNNGIITLKEKVKIVSEKGDQLETSFLLWDQYNQQLESDKLIRLIESSGDTTFGFGLVASEDFSRFQIKKGFAGKRQFQNMKERLNLND